MSGQTPSLTPPTEMKQTLIQSVVFCTDIGGYCYTFIGVCVWLLFCNAVPSVLLLRKRELVCITLIVFLLSCLRLCIPPTVLWVDLWSVVVAFPSHAHLIFIHVVCSLTLLHVDFYYTLVWQYQYNGYRQF